MRPIHLDGVNAEQLSELDKLYQTIHDARVRIRLLMVLLAAERENGGSANCFAAASA